MCCHNLLACSNSCKNCCMSDVQGRQIYFDDCIKNIFKIGFCSDSCEMISFKLGLMIDMTELYLLIPVRMTLPFTGLGELCSPSVLK